MTHHSTLHQAITAAKAGRKAEARRQLQQIIQTNPNHEQAWLWLSAVVESDVERVKCLERALALNPSNAMARQGLVKLGAGRSAPPPVPQPAPSPATARCAKCGFDNLAEARFCGRCGERLEANIPAGRCPSCGFDNPRQGKFCHQCGQLLPQQTVAAAPPPSRQPRPAPQLNHRSSPTSSSTPAGLIVGVVVTLVGLTICAVIGWQVIQDIVSPSLPAEARQALDKEIRGGYSIISAQRGVPQPTLFGLPDEVWCVVLNKSSASDRSYYLMRRQGLLWTAFWLPDEDLFLEHSCSNS